MENSSDDREALSFIRIEHFKGVLKRHGVNYPAWEEDAGTVEDLWKEIQRGEAKYKLSPEGLVRCIETVAIEIRCNVAGRLLRLVEKVRELPSGHRIPSITTTSISEKKRPGEYPRDTIVRALREELDMPPGLISIRRLGEKQFTTKSSRFPGLITQNSLEYFEVELSLEVYKEEGYIENVEGRKTYYSWEEVPEAKIAE